MDNAIKLFTVSETAEILRLSISKVYRMLSVGELPCIQIGTRKMVTQQDLIQFLELSRQETVKPPPSKKRHF